MSTAKKVVIGVVVSIAIAAAAVGGHFGYKSLLKDAGESQLPAQEYSDQTPIDDSNELIATQNDTL